MAISSTIRWSGAVYVFTRADELSQWSQQAYIKASNAEAFDFFGGDLGSWGVPRAMAINATGDVLVVGAGYESSGAAGIGADQLDNSPPARPSPGVGFRAESSVVSGE